MARRRSGRAVTGFTVLGVAVAALLAYETRIAVRQHNRTYNVGHFAERIASRVGPQGQLVAFQYGKLSYDFPISTGRFFRRD